MTLKWIGQQNMFYSISKVTEPNYFCAAPEIAQRTSERRRRRLPFLSDFFAFSSLREKEGRKKGGEREGRRPNGFLGLSLKDRSTL